MINYDYYFVVSILLDHINTDQFPRDFPLNKSWQKLLRRHKAIAVIRHPQRSIALALAHAVAAGGIKLIEITWNSDRPAELIAKLRVELPDCIIGAGTILNLHQLQKAIAAGAQFIFSPHFDRDLLEASLYRYQIPFVPGVFSPTEIVNAWNSGANTVKVFPIKALGGADYIKCLQAPLSQISLIPTGGVTIDNAKAMLEAGAIAVGVSGNLFLPELIAVQNWLEITNRTRILMTSL